MSAENTSASVLFYCSKAERIVKTMGRSLRESFHCPCITKKRCLFILFFICLVLWNAYDVIYFSMISTDWKGILMPAATQYCAHPALLVDFHQEIKFKNVAVFEVGKSIKDGNSNSHSALAASGLETLSSRYAKFWNYGSIIWNGDRTSHSSKLTALSTALETYNYVLFLDTDVIVVQNMLNLDGFISTLETSGKDILISKDKEGYNPRAVLFKNSKWTHWFLGELGRIVNVLSKNNGKYRFHPNQDIKQGIHHALQTPEWQKADPYLGTSADPSDDDLPLLDAQGKVVSGEEIEAHFAVLEECAFLAVDNYFNVEFAVHVQVQNPRVQEQMKQKFEKLAKVSLMSATRLTAAGPERLPIVHQTWKTHELTDPVMKARHFSWIRNGFRVQLTDDNEALNDIKRLVDETKESQVLSAYKLLSPVEKADLWRYVRIYLDGGIYSDIDIGARPETTDFFLKQPFEKLNLIGIIENSQYDKLWGFKNYLGHFNWIMGIAPLYSRLPQLRQSFFFVRKGHPNLLELIKDVAETTLAWDASGHTSLGEKKKRLSRSQLKEMEKSGQLTLEMTGPGIWTDHMLTPLKPSDIGIDGGSLLLSTPEGHNLIAYASMGSWKTSEHKNDLIRIVKNAVLIYIIPPAVLLCIYLRRKQRQANVNGQTQRSTARSSLPFVLEKEKAR